MNTTTVIILAGIFVLVCMHIFVQHQIRKIYEMLESASESLVRLANITSVLNNSIESLTEVCKQLDKEIDIVADMAKLPYKEIEDNDEQIDEDK